MRWFPRKIIDKKRGDMLDLIDRLRKKDYKVIEDYLNKTVDRINEHANNDDEYEDFDEIAFRKALKRHRGTDEPISNTELNNMRLDFYYFGSLEWDQAITASNFRPDMWESSSLRKKIYVR